MTRANVLLFGLCALLTGAIGYAAFRLIGLEGPAAGIAAEAVLVVIVFVWTGSYLIRVFTGKMTFVEQRNRYRIAYENQTNKELQSRFESLSEKEQFDLINEIESEENKPIPSSKDL